MRIELCAGDDQMYEVDGVRVPRATGVIADVLHTEFERDLFEREWVASLRGQIVHEFTLTERDDRWFRETEPERVMAGAYEYAESRALWTQADQQKVAEDVVGRVLGWQAFVKDELVSTRASEFPVAVPLQYAGTVDRRMVTRTWGPVTADLKPRLSPFASLQLAAYVEAGSFTESNEAEDILLDRRLVVVLDPKLKSGYKCHCYDLVPCIDSERFHDDVQDFMALLRVRNWKQRHGRLK